jgi:hypothetical protein
VGEALHVERIGVGATPTVELREEGLHREGGVGDGVGCGILSAGDGLLTHPHHRSAGWARHGVGLLLGPEVGAPLVMLLAKVREILPPPRHVSHQHPPLPRIHHHSAKEGGG